MFCPMSKVFEGVTRNIPDVTIIGGISSRVETPLPYQNIELNAKTQFYKVDVLGVRFDLDKVSKASYTDDTTQTKVRKLLEFMELSGHMVMALSSDFTETASGIVAFTGTLSRVAKTEHGFLLSKWYKGGDKSAWSIGSTLFEPLTHNSIVGRSLPAYAFPQMRNSLLANKVEPNSARKLPDPNRYTECGADLQLIATMTTKDLSSLTLQGAMFDIGTQGGFTINTVPEGDLGTALVGGNTSGSAFSAPYATPPDLSTISSQGVSFPAGFGKKPIIVDRDEVQPIFKEYDSLLAISKEKKDSTSNLLSAGLEDFEVDSMDEEEYITWANYVVEAIRKYWYKKPVGSSRTGRSIFISALENCFDWVDDNGAPRVKAVIEQYELDLLTLWQDGTKDESSFLPFKQELKELEMRSTKLLYSVVEVILGLGRSVAVLSEVLEAKGLSMFSVIDNNPYILGLLANNIKVSDLDRLFFTFKGIPLLTEEIKRSRNVSYINNFICDSNNRTLGGSTLLPEYILTKNLRVGFLLSSKEMQAYKVSKLLMLPEMINEVTSFLNPDMSSAHVSFPKGVIELRPRPYVKDNAVNIPQAINDFADSAKGVRITKEGKSYIANLGYFDAELGYLSLFKTMLEGVSLEAVPTAKDIDACVDEFEKMKAKELNIPLFKLEDKQRKAVHLIKHSVFAVTGCAGSGKTTTIEAILYALSALYSIAPEGVSYTAPTGKAAKRLREVVKRPTSTLHSKFRVFNNDNAYDKCLVGGEEDEAKEGKLGDMRVLVIDETSMVDLDLMTSVCSQLNPTIRVIFAGDIEQLSAIGFGKPFANILQYVPCVKLNVSRRASEKSKVTANATRIIDPTLSNERFIEGDDFIMQHVADANDIQEYILDICKYHLGMPNGVSSWLGGKSEPKLGVVAKKDIQIVSPLKKDDRTWGTLQLNKAVHDIFCPPNKQISLTFAGFNGAEDGEEFRVGDRVMHTENWSKEVRYEVVEGVLGGIDYSCLEGLKTSKGVMNGDIGEVMTFLPCDEVRVRDPLKRAVYKSNPFQTSKGDYIMFVKYEDVDETGSPIDFLIAYPIKRPTWRGSKRMYSTKSLTKANVLSLAYALTTHKMQGSAGKVIIYPIYSVGNFIDKSSLYTAITRASDVVWLLGDVLGANSAVEKARRIDASTSRLSLLDLYL